MKKYTILKRLSVFAVAGLLALSSCKKDGTEPEDTSVDQQAILVAEATTSSDAVFVVNAVAEGETKDSIATGEIHGAIKTYLEANYSGFAHVKAFKIKRASVLKGYIVVIKFNDKPIGLLFNANGEFIKVCEQRERGQLSGKGWKRGGRFDGRDGEHRDTVALNALIIAPAKAAFTLAYPQDTLLAAHIEREGTIVFLSKNKGLFANVYSANNIFVKRVALIINPGKSESIAQAILSAKIVTYLSTSYPAYVFHRAYVIKSNSTVQAYVLLINANDTKYAVHFDAAGNFVKYIVIK